jgi:hypothetical protein
VGEEGEGGGHVVLRKVTKVEEKQIWKQDGRPRGLDVITVVIGADPFWWELLNERMIGGRVRGAPDAVTALPTLYQL